jgi:hypothetical protein
MLITLAGALFSTAILRGVFPLIVSIEAVSGATSRNRRTTSSASSEVVLGQTQGPVQRHYHQPYQDSPPVLPTRKPPSRSPKQTRLPFHHEIRPQERASQISNVYWTAAPFVTTNNALRTSLSQVSVNPDVVQILLEKISAEACHCIAKQYRTKKSWSQQTPLEMVYLRYVNAFQIVKHLQARQQQGRGVDGWLGGGDSVVIDGHASPVSNSTHMSPSMIRATQEADTWWKVVVLMLNFLEQKTALNLPESHILLHTALTTAAPPQVIRTIVKQHPEYVHHKDANGQYPLHVACSPQLHAECRIRQEQQQLLVHREEIVILLLKTDFACDMGQGGSVRPSPAATRDKNGRYPLHLWTEYLGATSCVGFPKVVQQLIGAHPDVLGVLDCKFNLFPFLVVAADRESTEPNCVEQGCNNKWSDAGRVSAIHTFLREQPNLVKGGGR